MSEPPSPARTPRTVGIALAVFLGVVAVAHAFEWTVTHLLRPDQEEWTWVSEVIVTTALLVMTSLWIRLRFARQSIERLEHERVRMHAELSVAGRVQRALLPPATGLHGALTWCAEIDPAGHVGGDYFDVIPLDDDRVCLVLGDVSGKGVPAAVFVSNVRAIIRLLARTMPTLADLAAAVSETLRLDGGTLYVTALIVLVDTRMGTMVHVNAGHPPGLVKRARGDAEALVVSGPPMGLVPQAVYAETTMSLDTGDVAVLVSDGITDALDATGAAIPATLDAALSTLPSITPATVCAALLDRARHAPGPRGVTDWMDDRTVLAFGLTPPA